MSEKKKKTNLIALRKEKGWSQEKLGEMIEPPTSKQQIYQLESGARQLNEAWLQKLSKALGCKASDIIDDHQGLSEPPATPFEYAPQAPLPYKTGNDYVDIAVYDVQASAGHGAWADDEGYIVDHLTFKRGWLRKHTSAPINQLAIIKVNGDSMETTLSNGDTVLIDMTQNKPISGKLFVIWDDGALYVKRVQVQGGKVKLLSDNLTYSPYELSTQGTVIIGRVIWQGRSWE